MASEMSTSGFEGVLLRQEVCDFSLFHALFRLLHSHLGGWRHRRLVDLRVATGKDLLDEVFQVVCQMVAISYLPCLRSTFACGGGIIFASVTTDDINLW